MDERGRRVTRGTGRRVDDRHGLAGPDAVAMGYHRQAEDLMILAVHLRSDGLLENARQVSLRAAQLEYQAYSLTMNPDTRPDLAANAVSLYFDAGEYATVKRLAGEMLMKDSLRRVYVKIRQLKDDAAFQLLRQNQKPECSSQ